MRQLDRFIVTALVSLAASGAMAQSAETKARLKALKPADYPNHPIELSVGYAAGGGMDIVARMVAKKFEDYTGETLVINNRAGAGGLVFHRWILTQAPADGYSIGVANNIIIGDTLLRAENKWSYKDAENLAFINFEPVLWFSSSTGRFKDRPLSEIIKAAKKEPGSVSVATTSATLLEMLAEQVEQKASVNLNKIPFNSGKASITALMGDHIDISFGFLGEIKGLGDKVKPIGVASQKPIAALPSVPTFNNALKTEDVNWVMWRYVMAPKGLPNDRKTWLVTAFSEVMKDAQLNAELEKLGGIQDPNLDSPAKVTAELERLAGAERTFYVQTGRLK
jgi:tripartite-type tricarboxylate transporter receptor subunit TctC